MDKPQKKQIHDPVYQWREVQDYIEDKYKVQLRGYKREEPAREGEKSSGFASINGEPVKQEVYRDFWHHLVDAHYVRNGSSFSLEPDDALEYYDEPKHWWLREIYQMLKDEFGGDEIEFWVEW